MGRLTEEGIISHYNGFLFSQKHIINIRVKVVFGDGRKR